MSDELQTFHVLLHEMDCFYLTLPCFLHFHKSPASIDDIKGTHLPVVTYHKVCPLKLLVRVVLRPELLSEQIG